MGHVGCPDLPVISKCSRRSDCQQILHYHVSMVMLTLRYTTMMLTIIRSWPQPVLLKQIEEGPLQVRVWNPKVRAKLLYKYSIK